MDEKIDNKGNDTSVITTIKSALSRMSTATKVKWLLLIVVLAVILIVSNNFFATTQSVSNIQDSFAKYTYYVSSLDYCTELENKLRKVLSNLDGVGEVEVMISLDTSMELVLAESNKESVESEGVVSSNSYVVEVSSPIIIDSGDKEEPLIIKEILPKVKGVLVVLSQEQSVATRLSIIQAVQSLLDVNVSNIQVLSGGQ